MQAPRAKKVVQRWSTHEERTLLRAAVQAAVLCGPRFEVRIVPWTRVPGIAHSATAVWRRIMLYRLLKSAPPFTEVMAVAARVHAARVAAAREALQEVCEDAMRRPRSDGGGEGDDAPPELRSVPLGLREAVATSVVRDAVAIEDLSGLPDGALFAPRNDAEAAAHEEMLAGLEAVFRAVPVTQRPGDKGAKAGKKGDAEYDAEVALVCRPDGQRRRAPAEVLRNELRGSRVAGLPRAALGVAGREAGWREAACAAQLLGLTIASGADAGRALLAREAPRLLAAFSRELVAAAMATLRQARVLVPDAAAPLCVALSRAAVTAAEAVAAAAPPPRELAAAATWLHGECARGDAAALPIDTRASGALVATVLAGICGGTLELDAEAPAASEACEEELTALDQLAPAAQWRTRVAPASTAGAAGMHAACVMQTHALGAPLRAAPLTASALRLPQAPAAAPSDPRQRQNGAPSLAVTMEHAAADATALWQACGPALGGMSGRGEASSAADARASAPAIGSSSAGVAVLGDAAMVLAPVVTPSAAAEASASRFKRSAQSADATAAVETAERAAAAVTAAIEAAGDYGIAADTLAGADALCDDLRTVAHAAAGAQTAGARAVVVEAGEEDRPEAAGLRVRFARCWCRAHLVCTTGSCHVFLSGLPLCNLRANPKRTASVVRLDAFGHR